MTLSVAVANHRTGEAQVLYTDTPDNSLDVSLTAEPTVAVTAGPLVGQSKAKQATSTLLYITVPPAHAGMLADPQSLDVRCDGWTAEFLEGFWTLAPDADGQLGDLRVTVGNWPLFTTATKGQLYVEYHGFGDGSGFSRPLVLVHAAPSATPKPLKAHLAFGVQASGRSVTDHVNVWDERPQDDVPEAKDNTLVLRLVNDEPSPISSAGAGAARTSFRFMFAAGQDPSPNILTTDDYATGLQWAVPHGWEVPQLDTQAGVPCWTLTPPAGGVLLGAAADSARGPDLSGDHSVEFTLSGLVVRRPTGDAPVYLQHVNVPDHDDGFVSLDIPKVEPPTGILSFTSAMDAAPPKGGEVYLAWTTYDVDRVQLSYNIGNTRRRLSTPGDLQFRTGRYLVPDRIDDDTTYTLTATANHVISGSPWPITFAPYATDVEVLDLKVTPAVLGADAGCTLSFRVVNAKSVTLSIDHGSGTVPLEARGDGHVSCQLTSADGKTMTIKQGTVTLGALTRPTAIESAPPDETKVILRIAATGRGGPAQGTAGLNVSLPAPVVTSDLVFIETAGAAGAVDVHVLSGASGYQKQAHPPFSTAFDRKNGPDGTWTVSPSNPYGPEPSLMFIHTRETESEYVEASWLTLESGFRDGHTYYSDLDESKEQMGTWLAVNLQAPIAQASPSLILVATACPSTDANVVVVARSDEGGYFYAPWRKHGLATRYERTLGPKGAWLMADMTRDGGDHAPDLVFVQTADTASQRVELSYATGSSQFMTLGGQWVTGFVARDPAVGRWLLADMDGDGTLDLVYVKTAGTRSGRVEVYYASAKSGYARITGGYTAFAGADGPNGTWQVVPAGLLTPSP